MITVLTPTYNRAYTLERLFKSLLVQNNFLEWVIIDDGSTDSTKRLIASLQEESPFPIRYFYQENSGKHVAINTGTHAAIGEYLLIVDSDDMLTDDACTIIKDALKNIPITAVGVCFRKAYFDHTVIGKKNLPSAPLILSPIEAGYFFQGDLAYIFKTNALRSNPFPIISGEKFVPELLIWNRIADNGDIVFFPSTVIYLCEYLSDGYSANFKKNLRRNPKGFALYYRDQIRRKVGFVQRIKYSIRLFQCFAYSLQNLVKKS